MFPFRKRVIWLLIAILTEVASTVSQAGFWFFFRSPPSYIVGARYFKFEW